MHPENIPLTLYIHIPWCVRKCPYCDFNSHAVKDDIPEEAYTQALIEDLRQEIKRYPEIQERTLQAIFIGGGTPSLFSPQAIETLLKGIEQQLTFASTIEITLEANPGTAEQGKFSGFRAAGVNRLSLGIQSFQDQHLQRLGRIHSGSQAIKAIEMAKQVGFDNFNTDLMFALPQQTPKQALADLDQALALAPPHLSWYQLTIEPNTFFHHQPPKHLPNDDAIWEIQRVGQERLEKAGYTQYEVSAWSLAKRQCQHNRNYWEYGDYLGIGAGAHGKLTRKNKQIIRTAKRRHPRAYQAHIDTIHNTVDRDNRQCDDFYDHCHPIVESERPFEFMLNALRLREGVPAKLFAERTGLSLSTLQDAQKAAHAKKLLHNDTSRLQASLLGWQFLNELTLLFMPR